MKTRVMLPCLMIALLLFPQVHSGQSFILGTAADFVIFTSNGAVTNTGGSTCFGHIGSDLGTISGFGTSTITGTTYNANAVTAQAKTDLQLAYIQLMTVAATATHTPAFGANESLTTGAYVLTAAGSLGGNLTLNGLGDTSAVFIFRFGGAFTVGAAAAVSLTNGARACNVFWVVEGAISFAASTIMKGTFIANNAAVSMAASGDLEGRVFSTAGIITLGPSIAMKPGCTSSASLSPNVSQTTINLGTAASFVLFSGNGAVSNTGSSTLTGDIGSDAGAISGFGGSAMTGSFYNVDLVTAQAISDLKNAYNQLIALPITNNSHAPVFGGGEVLTKGVYYIGGAGSLGGDLTLDAQGDTSTLFIFRFSGAFTTGASSNVFLSNKALPCNVYWVAEGAIAMAASTTMKGTLIANNAAISMAAGGYLQGRLLTTSGALAFGPGSADLSCQISYTWASSGGNLFSDPLNWLPSGTPACMDNVSYTGASTVTCDFDQAITSVNNLYLLPGFANGTINTQSNVLIVNSEFNQSAGVFNGSSNLIHIYGDYLLSGGIFNSTSDTLMNEGQNFSLLGGTFNHNAGTVINNRSATMLSAAISGSFSFNKLAFSASGSQVERHINFNSSTTTASLLLNGGTTAFGYSGDINITADLIINGTNTVTPVLNTGTLSMSGPGAHRIVGTAAVFRNPIHNLVINTNGSLLLLNHVNVSGTWKQTNLGAFTAGTSTVDMINTCAIVSGTDAATRANFDNLSIAESAVLTIDGSSQLDIAGEFTDNGFLNASTSLIRLTGLSSQAISGSATLTTLNALEVTNTGIKTLNHFVDIRDSLKISNGTLASGTGYLTLKSDAALKGRIATISGATGAITGTIQVETFAPGGLTDWSVLGASGISGLEVKNWEGQIPMSCSLCPNDERSSGGYFVSVQGWNELAAAGSPLAYLELNYNSALTVGQGYWVYLGNGQSSTSAMVYSVSGLCAVGDQSISLTNSGAGQGDGYNLISNPYPSPISWTRLRNGNTSVDNAIYIYNADLGSTTSYVNGISTPASASVNDILPMGQGFYARANASTFLVAKETNKVSANTSADPLLKGRDDTQVLRLRIEGQDAYYDETVIRFEATASRGFDSEWDAHKMFSSPGYLGFPGVWNSRTSLATQMDQIDYSINSLARPLQTISIPLLARVNHSGTYTINCQEIEKIPENVCLVLLDKVTQQSHDLKTGPYSFFMQDTTQKARFELTICAPDSPFVHLTQKAPEEKTMRVMTDETGVMIFLDFDEPRNVRISISNMLGQSRMKDITLRTAKDAVHVYLPANQEVLFIRVLADDERLSKKLLR